MLVVCRFVGLNCYAIYKIGYFISACRPDFIKPYVDSVLAIAILKSLSAASLSICYSYIAIIYQQLSPPPPTSSYRYHEYHFEYVQCITVHVTLKCQFNNYWFQINSKSNQKFLTGIRGLLSRQIFQIIIPWGILQQSIRASSYVKLPTTFALYRHLRGELT